MAYLRQLSNHFDPVYIKPGNLAKALRQWQPTSASACAGEEQQLPPRRDQDRRCGIERRRRQVAVLLDTRTPHARRKVAMRRRYDGHHEQETRAGIDVYA